MSVFDRALQRRAANRKRLMAERRELRTIAKAAAHAVQASSVHIPDSVLAEREARSTLSPRNLTAAFCGDPLPGYSALERRR